MHPKTRTCTYTEWAAQRGTATTSFSPAAPHPPFPSLHHNAEKFLFVLFLRTDGLCGSPIADVLIMHCCVILVLGAQSVMLTLVEPTDGLTHHSSITLLLFSLLSCDRYNAGGRALLMLLPTEEQQVTKSLADVSTILHCTALLFFILLNTDSLPL
jgi:hypothetical protein